MEQKRYIKQHAYAHEHKTGNQPIAECECINWLQEINLQHIQQLIRIEVADRPAAPLVPMAQQYFLRENLKLRLLTARIALLARNDASFQADLSAVDAWLKQYFDTRAKPVQALQATVRQLALSPMPGETPDLNRSLEALRVLRLGQDRAGGRGPAGASAPR